MDEASFWMVWNPKGRAPTVQHDTKDRALQEAQRLALVAPGETFFVLQAVAKAKKREPVEVTMMFDETYCLPF